MEREKFYIFLDIDGTLYTQKDIYRSTSNGFPVYMSESYWPEDCNNESRDAFNKIINTLEQKYDTEVVIISRKRKNMDLCEHYLKEVYKLQIAKPLKCTPYIDGTRANKIIGYLQNNYQLFPKTKNLFNNFLNRRNLTSNYGVIDDDTAAKDHGTQLLSKTFDSENYIHVEGKHSSLKMEQVDNFLKNKLLEPDDLQR